MEIEFEKAAEYIEKEISIHSANLAKLRKNLWLNVWLMALLAVVLYFFTYMSVNTMVQGLSQVFSSAPDKLRIEGDTIKVVGEQIDYGHIVLAGFLIVLIATVLQIKNENSIIKNLRKKKSRIFQVSILANKQLSEKFESKTLVQCLAAGDEATSDLSPAISALEKGVEKITDAVKSLSNRTN